MPEPRVYSLTANSSSQPIAPPSRLRQGSMSKTPSQARRNGKLTPAARIRRLLPWALLLLAGSSMIYEAFWMPAPANTQPGSHKAAHTAGMKGILEWSIFQPGSQLLFPEMRHHFTQLSSGSSRCGQPVSTPRSYLGLQRALQACLGHPRCTWVSYHPSNGSAQLCSGHWERPAMLRLRLGNTGPAKGAGAGAGMAEVIAVRNGCERYTGEEAEADAQEQLTAQCLAEPGPGRLCPLGLTPVVSTETGMACDVCGPSGYCSDLKEAELVGGFNEALQQYVNATMRRYRYRAFNPTLASHLGRLWVLARVSNATNCGEEVPRLPSQLQGDGTYINNHVLLCPLRDGGELLPELPECRYVHVDVSGLAKQMPGLSPTDITGLEDARAFELDGRLHLLSFFYRINDTQRHNMWRRHRLRWYMPEAGRRSYMFVARLGKDLKSAEKTTAILCPELKDKIHKNWMPLIMGGTLYLVTHAQPLTVIKPDLDTGTCEVISRETASGVRDSLGTEEGGLLGGSHSISAPASSLLASSSGGGFGSAGGLAGSGSRSGPAPRGSPSSKFEGGSQDAAFAAVLGGRHVHGGAPFIEIAPGRFLSIVHHGHDFTHGRVYSHHFIMVQPSAEGGFETAFLSEAFRLPEPPSPTPGAPCSDVQFSSGLVLVGDRLYISYGSKDCHSLLAVVPSATTQLQRWLERGMGTQEGGPKLVGDDRTVVKWGARIFGVDPEPFDVATAIISRWLENGYNKTTQILLRHLIHSPDKHFEWRDLRQAGVDYAHFVDTNHKNNMLTNVAITHGRLGDVRPEAAATWIPYVNWQGAVNMSQLNSLARHAAEIWVSTSFHKAALLHVGARASQVQVLPLGLSPLVLCPTGLATHPRPPALDGARGFIFLHRAYPEWHNGAGVLLEAYEHGFSAADDVTLVLHAPPGERYQFGPQLEELKAKVSMLQAQPGAPHVLLITRSLSFGRQAEKMMAAADALVQPYLAGEPLARDLLLPMSCGKPVITTEYGPAADLVGENEGYLVGSRWGQCNTSAVAAAGEEEGGRWRVWDEGEGAVVEAVQQQQQAQHGVPRHGDDLRLDVCREVDPESLASVMLRAHADAAGRQAKGQAAAAAAKALVGQRGWDAVARQAWQRVEARLGRQVPAEQQHRKVIV